MNKESMNKDMILIINITSKLLRMGTHGAWWISIEIDINFSLFLLNIFYGY